MTVLVAVAVTRCAWCVWDGVGGCSQHLVAANETVTTSTGDLKLLIVDAESVDIPCADADVTSVDMGNEVVTVLHSFSYLLF